MEEKNILPNHFVTFAKWNKEITKYPSIIEGSFCEIKVINDLVEKEDIIICLGFGGKDKEYIINSIIKHDTELDYTKNWSKEKLTHHFCMIDVEDKENIKYCKENNIKYFNTSINRKRIFNEIISFIKDANKV